MISLFKFLFRIRIILAFLILEAICFILIVNHNRYQQSTFLNSSNAVVASINQKNTALVSYFNLEAQNETLVSENSRLRDELDKVRRLKEDTELKLREQTFLYDSTAVPILSEVAYQFEFRAANVINNSTMLTNNYLTLDKGSLDKVAEGMGVIGPEGIVGRIYSVSDHFSLAISLLHSEVLISSVIKRENILCSTTWDGESAQFGNLLHVPRHFSPVVGDTVVTSSYNAIYPPGAIIGTVAEVEIGEGATFYEIKVDLSTDFNSVSTVYVLYDSLKNERTLIESQKLE